MKQALLLTIMVFFVVGVILSWSLTLTRGLPAVAYLYAGGRLLALLGFVTLSFQYLWVSKIRFIEAGMSTAWLLRLHRRFGVVALLLLVLHPTALIVSERLQGYIAPLGPLKTMGVVALALLLAAGGAALLSRKLHLKYRMWKGIHRLAYGVFPIAFVHGLLLGTSLQKTVVKAGWAVLVVIYVAHVFQRILRRSPAR